MICAYDKVYLERAQEVMAAMLDYGINALGNDLRTFYNGFLHSEISKEFEMGNPFIIAGHSGTELALQISRETAAKAGALSETQNIPDHPSALNTGYCSVLQKSEEYWLGWSLAYYQWKSAAAFSVIDKEAPAEQLILLYHPYHEMDIEQFTDKVNELRRMKRMYTYLRIFRERAGLTQQQLADCSGIPLRTLQQYEQRQKSINKAQAEYVIKLSRVLSCRPDELMEF